MANTTVMAHCASCGRARPHLQPTTSHLLHLVLSLFTLGLWVVIWVLAALSTNKATCTVCATEHAPSKIQVVGLSIIALLVIFIWLS